MGLETAAIIAIGAAAATTATGVVSSLASSKASKEAQQSANETNVQLAREQMAYQTSERLAAQEYNTPANQRARFEQAGINPYLALGQIDAGNTEMQTGVTPAQVQPAPGLELANLFKSLGGSINDSMSLYQGLQQIQGTEEAVKQAKIESQFKGQEKLLQMLNLQSDISVKMSQVDKNSQEYRNLQQEHEKLSNDIAAQRINNRYLEEYNQGRNRKQREETDLIHNQAITEHYTAIAKKVESEYAPRLGEANLNRINAAAASEYASAAASGRLAVLYSEQGKTEFEMRVLTKAGVKLDNEAKSIANQYLGRQISTSIDLMRSQTGKNQNETNIFHYLGPAAIGAGLGIAGKALGAGRTIVSGFK